MAAFVRVWAPEIGCGSGVLVCGACYARGREAEKRRRRDGVFCRVKTVRVAGWLDGRRGIGWGQGYIHVMRMDV